MTIWTWRHLNGYIKIRNANLHWTREWFYLPKEFHVIEMDWWQEIPYHELRIIYTPAQHGSGRGCATRIRHFGAAFRSWLKQVIVSLRVIPVMRVI